MRKNIILACLILTAVHVFATVQNLSKVIKSDEVVVQSALWGWHEKNDPSKYDYWVESWGGGFYSFALGGTLTLETTHRDWTEDWVYVLAPGGTYGCASIEDVYWYDSEGHYWDYGTADTPTTALGYSQSYPLQIQVEQGALSVADQSKYSIVKLIYMNGGAGKIGLQVLVGASVPGVEETTSPSFVSGSAMDPTKITLGDLGPQTNNGVAYGVVINGNPVDVTPSASVPMAWFDYPYPTKYHCYFTAYAEEPNPGDGKWAAYGGHTAGFGHAWWTLTSDAPYEALQKVGVHYQYYMGGAAGYYPTDQTIWLTLVDVPAVLHYPNGGGTQTVHRKREIGINGLIDGLTYTKNVALYPDYYDLFDQNCTTITIKAGAHAGVTLPNDIYPQNFGIDLNTLPPDE